MRSRLPFLGLALAAVAGVFVADRCALPLPALWGAFAATALLSLLVPRTWLCLLCAFTAFATVHTLAFKQSPWRELERSLAAGPRLVSISGIVWSEPEPLPYFSPQQTGTFRLRTEDGGLVLVKWAGRLPSYGDRVTIEGQLQGLEAPRNPGQLDYAGLLQRRGIFAQIDAKFPPDCRITGHGAGNSLVALSLRTSHWIGEQLKLDLDDSPEIASLITSMVLGLRGETPAEVKDMFRTTGTLHLFAVSGLNIAMLAIIASYVLKPLGLGRRTVAAITIPILLFYALVTGLSASCVRAAIMGSLVLLGLLLERPAVVYNSLAAAAALILAWDTNQLFVPGFQFSFVLVFVIVFAANRISGWLEKFGQPDAFLPQPLWSWRQQMTAFGAKVAAGSIGVTLAAWVGSLVFMAGYFHIISPAGIVANLVAIPLAFGVLALGLATLVTAPLVKPVAIIFSNANWLCAKALLASVKMFSLLPGGHVYVELPKTLHSPGCEVEVLDMADGGAVHLRSGRANWLVDSGAGWRYENTTLPYLRSRGVNRLDAFLATHGDSNHIGAATTLFDDFTPRLVLESTVKDRSASRRKLHTELNERRRGLAFARRGDSFTLGQARIEVLFPPTGWQQNLADDKAIVLRVECEGRRILLMSDSGFAAENWLVHHEPDLRADVLVKGHHERDVSGTPDFIEHVKPGAVIVGTLNLARDPAEFAAWVHDIEARGIAVFRQDRCGAVTLAIRDGELDLRGFVNDQTFRSRAR
jgi:ComEC/Rec2-related protein